MAGEGPAQGHSPEVPAHQRVGSAARCSRLPCHGLCSRCRSPSKAPLSHAARLCVRVRGAQVFALPSLLSLARVLPRRWASWRRGKRLGGGELLPKDSSKAQPHSRLHFLLNFADAVPEQAIQWRPRGCQEGQRGGGKQKRGRIKYVLQGLGKPSRNCSFHWHAVAAARAIKAALPGGNKRDASGAGGGQQQQQRGRGADAAGGAGKQQGNSSRMAARAPGPTPLETQACRPP